MVPGYHSHRDANGVDTQLLQTLDILLGEPTLPMVIEDLVGIIRVGLGEGTVDLHDYK